MLTPRARGRPAGEGSGAGRLRRGTSTRPARSAGQARSASRWAPHRRSRTALPRTGVPRTPGCGVVTSLPSSRAGAPGDGAEPGAFREAMRRWATGVAVVTTRSDQGPHGVTVNSLLSMSIDPPTLLIPLKRGSRTEGVIERVGRFTVNVLTAGSTAADACRLPPVEGSDRPVRCPRRQRSGRSGASVGSPAARVTVADTGPASLMPVPLRTISARRREVHGLRATSPHWSTSTGSSPAAGRHCEIDTKPGSTSSRPSAHPVISSGSRTR
ncbi:flavin reductase (DIM6/NTAB) family NADH-FMN oxidoreductase RutF [Streptomyces sp. TE33382]